MLEPNYDYNMDMVEGDEEEEERVENMETIDTWITPKNDREACIKNIKEFIVCVQFADELYNVLTNKKDSKNLKCRGLDFDEYFEKALSVKRTSGLNPGDKQLEVNHSISNIEELKTFLTTHKVKIDYYKSNKSWWS